MNEILTAIQAFVGIFLVIFNVVLVYRFNRKIDERIESAYDYLDDLVTKAVNFYAKEKSDFVNNLPKLVQSAIMPVKMSALGKASGISRQLKGLERDLLADGITAATGIPGNLVAKYVQKYPILMQLLPMLMRAKGAPVMQSNSGGELGKIG